MKPTRRQALQAAAAAAGAMSLASGRTRAAEGGPNSAKGNAMASMPPLDYGRSFICHTAPFNSVRFWVESRTRIIDDESGAWTDYYQCGSCKSENTFAEQDLLKEGNYDFLPIMGRGLWLVFRRPVGVSESYRTVSPVDDLWGPPVLKLREDANATVLDTWETIRGATAAAVPIVTQTELANAETGLRAIIECPTKTMNISLDKTMYQVDTGPITFPDLTKRHDPMIDSLSLAFIAFNAPDFADFIIEQPTPVPTEDPAAKCETYHYSKPFSLPAKNRVLALMGVAG
ncbi:MAG: twin-arginine translocation signal domain-containing protein [Nitrospiraceae bacterium]|nr:twin-arginine translocation signal domain-containing protein [Nitrospiraceae bacterium]